MRSAGSLIAGLVLLVGITSCSATNSFESGDNQGFISGDGTARLIDRSERVDAPDIHGTTLDGDEYSLDDNAGDVVVMNVWASWCGPCRAEAPALQEVFEQNKKKGVAFVGINVQDDEANANAFINTYGITYPSLSDSSGEIQLEFHDSFPPVALPWTVIIDRDGGIAGGVAGPTSYSQLSDLVDQVLEEKQ